MITESKMRIQRRGVSNEKDVRLGVNDNGLLADLFMSYVNCVGIENFGELLQLLCEILGELLWLLCGYRDHW